MIAINLDAQLSGVPSAVAGSAKRPIATCLRRIISALNVQGYDYAEFRSRLASTVVGLAFDGSAAHSPEGRQTVELSASLLARLYPRIRLVPLTGEACGLASELEVLVRGINPDIEIIESEVEPSVWLAVGATPMKEPQPQVPTIYLGSNSWVAKLSSHEPVGSGSSGVPFGAGAAACFGAANVFRAVFGDQLPCAKLDESICLSLLDYDSDSASPTNPEFEGVDLGEAHLVGLGAIGNGAVWALSHTNGLHGTLHMIDDEVLDLTNLQRYILAYQEHAALKVSKVSLAAETLKGAGLALHPHPMAWGQYLRTLGHWRLERVAVAVDSAEDRRAVQASLPRWLFNAWTQAGDLGVSRHTFIGDQACLVCLYMPQSGQKNEDQLVAEAIGLPGDLMEVRQMLHTGAPVGRHWLEAIADALHVSLEPLFRFEHHPLRSFYSEAICGGVVLSLGGGTERARAEVPMAFQSALAGIMLAAELVANAAGFKEAPPPVTTKIDLLKPLGKYLSLPMPKPVSGTCICQDQDYVSEYKRLHG